MSGISSGISLRSLNVKLLAVDTSTEACSAALLIDGECRQQYRLAPREHSRLILGMIDGLLNEAGITAAGLDALAFGRGPGSFMGIRIAAGVVQGIAFAHSIPVVPVSTLAAMATLAMDDHPATQVLAAIDARMQEVYWGAYICQPGGGLQLLGEEMVVPPAQAPMPDEGEWLAAGTGWSSYGEILRPRLGDRLVGSMESCYPSARAIASLAVTEYDKGNTVSAAEAVPVYLRDRVASKPKQPVPGEF